MIAPSRADRPGAWALSAEPVGADELDECPFCEGREDRTPPEVFALPQEGRAPDTPGWQIRVVPNLYPALERQEVVVHAPEHVRSFAELGSEQVAMIAEAWERRAETAADEGFAYVQAAINEGRAAGASLPHSHSQLFWFRELPPELTLEQARLAREPCALCDLVADQVPGGPLLVGEVGGVTMLAAQAGRAPYELLLAGAHGDDGFDRGFLTVALGLLGEGIRRLHTTEGAVPWNAWLHAGPHPHFELVPRLTIFAGLELGTGVYVNPLAPETAAARLREQPGTVPAG